MIGLTGATWSRRGGMGLPWRISLGELTGGLGYMAVAPDTAALAVVIALGVSILSAMLPGRPGGEHSTRNGLSEGSLKTEPTRARVYCVR